MKFSLCDNHLATNEELVLSTRRISFTGRGVKLELCNACAKTLRKIPFKDALDLITKADVKGNDLLDLAHRKDVNAAGGGRL